MYIYTGIMFFFFLIFIFFDDVLKQFQVLASGVSGVSRYLQHFATDWWNLPILTAVLEPRQPQGVMLLDSKWRTRIGAAMPCCSHGISWLASLITSMEPMEPPRFRRVTWRWIWNILELDLPMKLSTFVNLCRSLCLCLLGTPFLRCFKRCTLATLDESDQPLKLQGLRHGGLQGEVLKFLVLASS